MTAIEWRRGCVQAFPPCSPEVGWTPSSLGPVPKISHWSGSVPPVPEPPTPASPSSPSEMKGQPSTSLKNALVAGASSE